ncbi:MAG: DUF4012 domain-containing protein [Candidatus Magasanikbacteria bacterium]|nr:DUF4012 domain-containing protein [Candidatus Magasanikbacteria bacterium]
MLRRKKQENTLNGKTDFKHKFIPVFFSQEEKQSPHVLNLPEKLTPPPPPTWEPTQLDRFLSNPLADLNKPNLQQEKKQEPLRLKLNFKLPQESFLSKFSFELPHWRLPHLPKFKSNLSKKEGVDLKIKLVKKAAPVKVEFQPQNFSYSLPSWQRAIASFAVMALLLVLPIKAFSAFYQLRDSQQTIVASGTTAFEHLNLGQEAMQKGDFGSATQELQLSLNSFAEAQNKLDTIHPFWRSLLYFTPKIGDKLKNGEELMLAGTNLTLGSLPVLYLLTEKNQSGISLAKVKETLDEVAPRFAKTNDSLMRVNPDYLPEENRAAFLKIREAIFLLNDDLQKINSLSKSLLTAAGINEEKTYLVVFQNNNEIRPTGGFIGSYAEIKIKNGQITKIDIPGEGSYKISGTLMANLAPPAPIQLLQPRWEFRDANWFPDFPTSAKKLMWFYEKGGGPTLDGLIAIDTNPMIDLMKIVGSIDLPTHNITVDANNFIDVIQKKVELDYDKTKNQPKEILADLAPLVLEKLFNNKNNLLPLLSLTNKNLTQKHIQFYFADKTLEKDIISQGWGGEMKDNPEGDYLAVINANIGGDKSDRVIEQTIQHQAKILDDGTVLDTVTITRNHLGSDNVFSNVKNNSYIRFYVPRGSQLLSAEGFIWPEENTYRAPETWYNQDEDLEKTEKTQTVEPQSGTTTAEESDKTVFANWMIVRPGETAKATITYRLPFKIKKPEPQNTIQLIRQLFKQDKNYSSYSLLAQKQAGSNNVILESTISWPENWKILWTNPFVLNSQENQVTFNTYLDEDKFLGLVFNNSYNQ